MIHRILFLVFLFLSSYSSYAFPTPLFKSPKLIEKKSFEKVVVHPLEKVEKKVVVVHPLEKVEKKIEKKVEKKEKKKCSLFNIGCDISKIERGVQTVVKNVKNVETKIKKSIMLHRDIQYAISLLKKGKEFAEEEWTETKEATKTLSKVLNHIGKATNIISIAVEDLVKCPTCSVKCNVCRIGVDELLSMGEFETCGVVVPTVCQVIGLGPEDPLSDLCSVGMGIACGKLEDRLTKMASPKRLCSDIHMCK